MSGYRIGEVADRVGMSVEGLRSYERRGLLPEPPRTRSGYRVYQDRHLERLHFVKAAQEMGFTLDEIASLLALRERGGSRCSEVHEQLQSKLVEVRRRIALLQGFAADLEAATERCRRQLEEGASGDCPVLSELGSSLPEGAGSAARGEPITS